MASEHSHSRFDEESRDGAGLFEAHDMGLFDQDESSAGEKYDLATGRPINNSTHGYDDLGSIDDETAAELGFSIVSDADYDDEGVVELLDHWVETQRGLAQAAGIDYPFDNEDIA
mgnify:CR=1 FL=1